MAWTFVWLCLPPAVTSHPVANTSSPTEIIAFSDATKQFADRGAKVVFVSVDSEYSLSSWANTPRKDGGLGSVNIPLLTDKNHKISRAYGVLIEEEGIALRGLFIIDPNGIVRQVRHNQSRFLGSTTLKKTRRLPSTTSLSVVLWTRPFAFSMPSSLPRRYLFPSALDSMTQQSANTLY